MRPENRASLIDRIKALAPDCNLDENAIVHYSWDCGYEKLDISYVNRRGGQHYAGMHHPLGLCKTENDDGEPGVCIFCGKTMW